MEEKQNTQRAKRWEPRKMREISKKEQQMLLGQRLVERDGKWYGFNQKGEFVCLGIEIYKNEKVRVDTSKVWDIISGYWALMTFGNVEKALTRLKVGDDIQTLNDTITQIKKEKKEAYQAAHPSDTLDRFIAKIEKPIFERTAGNTQKGTFDFIRIEVSIVTQWHTNRVGYIKEHQKEIGRAHV